MHTYLKIPQSVRSHFELLECTYTELKEIVDAKVKECIPDRWIYVSRIKTVESFYAKMSQGRMEALYEDILACTVVVEQSKDIQTALSYLNGQFDVKYKKPSNSKESTKPPESFRFDDLRLYMKLKDRPSNNIYKECLFEMQVKTILQHAWTVATHDLIYKSDRVDSWAKKRVAYQIKAMLEHVETSIAKVDELATSDLINLSTRQINDQMEIARQIKNWNYDLGSSTTRIVESIQGVLPLFEVKWKDVVAWVESETRSNPAGGLNVTRFSLFEIVLDVICKNLPDALAKYKSNLVAFHKGKLIVANEFIEIHPECKEHFLVLDD